MLTEDYILRMINLGVAALLRAIGLRKEGHYDQAHQTVQQALEQLTGLRADLLTRLDERGLLDLLSVQEELDHDRTMLIADLYHEQGENFKAQNRPGEACFPQLRALNLALESSLSRPIEEVIALKEKIEVFAASVKTCHIPFETSYSLFNFYEVAGAYSEAERTLRPLIQHPQFGDAMRQEYQDFCDRLLEKTDRELEQAGLTRNLIQSMNDDLTR